MKKILICLLILVTTAVFADQKHGRHDRHEHKKHRKVVHKQLKVEADRNFVEHEMSEMNRLKNLGDIDEVCKSI